MHHVMRRRRQALKGRGRLANRFVILASRAVVSIRGGDARTFLQGLISQDVERVGPDRAAYGAFLTPQGKYLHDFCIAELDGAIVLDCEAARAEDLVARLSRYRLRADVTLAVDTSLAVAAIFGGPLPEGLPDVPGSARGFSAGLLFVDPRHVSLGCRAVLLRDTAAEVLEKAGFVPGGFAAYEALRIALTVPDGSRDLDVEKTVLLEANFDTLNGVDWEKGCYLGQELTARTRYRGLVKRRLVTVAVDAPAPAPGTPIEHDGKQIGVLRTTAGGRAIASLRTDVLDAFGTADLHADGRPVHII
jgi:hypothetical protein